MISPPDARTEAIEVTLERILPMRVEYRREMNAQIVHDSWHARGLTRSYHLMLAGELVGYGAVGGRPREAKDIVKELYIVPARRGDAALLLQALVSASGAQRIEAQTNDPLLLSMLHVVGADASSETILFADGLTTALPPPLPGVVFRPIDAAEHSQVFAHTHEPVGEWGLELDGEIIATGGVAFHYNPPYGDIYMEVAAPHRRKGAGSYLVQELKRVCHKTEHRPAARCHQDNVASHRTLERAGMIECARIFHARLTPNG